jgi:hypothetical protein
LIGLGQRLLRVIKLPNMKSTDDIVCEYPQSGEVIRGRGNLQALRSHHPGRPSGFSVRRIVGKDNLWITEYVIIYEGKRVYTVSIMEFRDGKVSHETQYFADPFNALLGAHSGSKRWRSTTSNPAIQPTTGWRTDPPHLKTLLVLFTRVLASRG